MKKQLQRELLGICVAALARGAPRHYQYVLRKSNTAIQRELYHLDNARGLHAQELRHGGEVLVIGHGCITLAV